MLNYVAWGRQVPAHVIVGDGVQAGVQSAQQCQQNEN